MGGLARVLFFARGFEIFLKADTAFFDFFRGLGADVAEVPRFVADASYVGFVFGVAFYKSVFIRIFFKPFPHDVRRLSRSVGGGDVDR